MICIWGCQLLHLLLVLGPFYDLHLEGQVKSDLFPSQVPAPRPMNRAKKRCKTVEGHAVDSAVVFRV